MHAPRPEFAPIFTRGVELFNAQKFWEAHEAWEELWLAARSDLREFLQGLIQLAAAYHHFQRGTSRGGVRLADAALARLARHPAGTCGIDRSAAEEAALRHRAWAVSNPAAPLPEGEAPALIVLAGGCSPPREEW